MIPEYFHKFIDPLEPLFLHTQKLVTMFIVRDIFHLKFGHFREAKALFDEAKKKNMFMNLPGLRLLSDFTGPSYRLIMEENFPTLADFEKSLSSTMHAAEWQAWYEKFKPLVESSHREILKQVV